MSYRLIGGDQSKGIKPNIVYPNRGEPPKEAPLEGYERDPGNPYVFRPKRCVHLYVTCEVKSCCIKQICKCILYGDIECNRCHTCTDKKI